MLPQLLAWMVRVGGLVDLYLSEAAADSLLCRTMGGWLLRLLRDEAERVLPVSWLRWGLSVRHS